MSSFYNLFSAENENEETLEHHSALGVKLGVRRHQNYDGTRIKKKTSKILEHSAATVKKTSEEKNADDLKRHELMQGALDNKLKAIEVTDNKRLQSTVKNIKI